LKIEPMTSNMLRESLPTTKEYSTKLKINLVFTYTTRPNI
jgi:hypothetical protein